MKPTLGRAEILLLLPLIAVCLFVLGINLWAIFFRMTWDSPLNPWEAAYVVAGESVARGIGAYHVPGDPKSGIGVEGHAAVMYGPAQPFLIGLITKVIGVSPYTGRVISLTASVAIVALAVLLQPRRTWLAILITLTTVIAVNWRSRLFFTDARPDMLAWLLAGLALMCFFRAHQTSRWMWYAPGIALLVTAFLFKQTVSIYAFVPGVLWLLHDRERAPRKWWLMAMPAAAIALTVGFMWLFTWNAFHYSVRMPSYWPIRWPRVWDAAANALTYDPLFVLCMAIWLVRPEMPRPRMLSWLAVTAGVGIVGGALFFAKSGGSFNSYIPAWLPAAIFSATTLSWLITECDLPRTMRALAIGLVIPVAMLTSAIGIPRGFSYVRDFVHGHDNYRQAIEVARGLPGTVVCPEDPTIPLLAKGVLNRTYTVEVESIQYRYIPALMQQEMYSADWLLWLRSPFTELLEPIDFERLGFVPVFDAGFAPETYILFKRDWSLEPMKLRQSITKTRGPGRPTTTQSTTEPAANSNDRP